MNAALRKSTCRAAFTLTDLVIVIAILLLFLFLSDAFYPGSHAKQKAKRISCVNNLKQIGTAYGIWANDHGNQYPSEASITNGGWRELLDRGNAGAVCWTNYAIVSNQLYVTRLVVCPSDERTSATDFSQFTNNLSLSYFVGVGVDDMLPQSILSGDRNLDAGPDPDPAYGFSPASGQGNDVVLKGPIGWSQKMHTEGNVAGAGNILMGDGSVQQVTSEGFRVNWLLPALRVSVTNHIPVRVVFP